MTDSAMRNIIASEFRAMQQRMQDRSITKADLQAVTSQLGANSVTRQDLSLIRASLDEIKFELKSQRQLIKQHSAYIESLNQNTRNNTNQLGSLWRFVQQ